MLACYQAMQDEFFYCADTMVRGAYPRTAPRLWKKRGWDYEVSDEDKADLLAGKADFMAFSYYSSSTVTTHTENHEVVGGNLSSGPKNPYVETSDWGWQMDPTGYRYFLNVMYDRYQVPLFDVENGLGAFDEVVVEDGVQRVHDQNRIEFLRNHIQWMAKAVDDGVEMVGYCTWAAIDLYSTREGFGKRYGFVYVDADNDFKRIKKDSFAWYTKVIASNGEDLAD